MTILDWQGSKNPTRDDVVRAMPLAVRMEKGATVIHDDVLIATVKAIALLLDDESVYSSKHFRHEIQQWNQDHIRKVARRARATRWTDLHNVPGVLATAGTAEVRAFIPYDVEHTPTPLSRLQVSGLEALRDAQQAPIPDEGMVLNIAVNPDVPMSTGKQMAQVGHIAHIAALQSDESILQLWKDSGFQVRLTDFDTGKASIKVRDAGFTEVEPGTLTALGKFTKL